MRAMIGPSRRCDAARVLDLRFRNIMIDFDGDDPRPKITADVESCLADTNELRAIYESGTINIGPEASLFVESGHHDLRMEREIDIFSPYGAGAAVLRGSGRVFAHNKEGRVSFVVRVPYQRRAWRITIELDGGERIPPPEPVTIRQPGLIDMLVRSARPLHEARATPNRTS